MQKAMLKPEKSDHDSVANSKEIKDLMETFKLKFFENKKVNQNLQQLERTQRREQRLLDDIAFKKNLVKVRGKYVVA